MKLWTPVFVALVLLTAGAQSQEVSPEAAALNTRAEIEKARAEAERARAQAARARAEAERARVEAERARVEAERARVEAERARAEVEKLKTGFSPAQPAAIPPGAAPDPVSDPGFHRHDGLFLRMTGGPGFGGFEGTGHAMIPRSTDSITDPSQRGPVAGGSFSLGGTIGDNLILHGDIWFSAATTRKREVYHQEFATAVVGGGVTWYWMPANFYLSGALGLAGSALSVRRDTDPLYTNETGRESIQANGAGLMLMAGKEWWVSANWALGAAMVVDFSYAEGNDLTIRQGSARALFSASYN